MSDYLGHLVTRSFAPKAGIQPRLPSIFEPLPGSVSFDRTVDFERNLEVQTGPAFPASHETSALAKPVEPPGSRVSSPASPHISTSAPPPPVSVPDHHREIRTDSDAPAAKPVSAALPEHITPIETPPAPIVIRQAAPPPVVIEEKLPPAPPHRNGKIEPAIRSKSHSEEILRGPDQRDLAPKNELAPPAPTSSRRHVDSALPGVVIRPVQIIQQAPILPVNAGRSAVARNTEISNPAPVPTIQVTIGRLEVRASTPAAATPRARAGKAPTMSLETYLQRRAERGV